VSYPLYTDRINDQQSEIIDFIDELILSFPGVSKKIRYKVAFYKYIKWICYLNPVKPNQVELCFLRGKELSNRQGILNDRGRKQVSGIMLTKLDDNTIEAIREIFSEALLLEEQSNKVN